MTDSYEGDIEVVDLAARIVAPPAPTLVPPRQGGGATRAAMTRRRVLLVAGVLLLAMFLWLALAGVTLLGIRSDVLEARDQLLESRDLLFAGDLEGAGAGFDGAAATLGSMPARVTSPRVWPVRQIRSYRATLNAVGDLGAAGELAAAAAGRIVTGIVGGEGGLGALTPRDGRLPLQAIADLGPLLADGARDVADAIDMAQMMPLLQVDRRVVDAREELLDVLVSTEDQLRLGADLAEVIPALFGADGPRRYAVLSANPTETRGTGGFFGAFSVVEVDDGVLSFGPVVETQGLPIPTVEDVPWPDPSLAARYDFYGGATRLRSINMTPDFPSAATAIERFFTIVLDTELDGVISIDPFAFEALLRVSGPIDLPGFGIVQPDQVVNFVSYSAYALVEDPAARKRLIGTVAASTFQEFLSGPEDVVPSEVLQALASIVQRESILIHSTRPQEQALLVESGLAGELTANGGDLLAITLNSGSGSKVDYWLSRTIRYEVTLEADGRAAGILSAGFRNDAPDSGELTYMIGPVNGVDYGPGDNITWMSVYCAPGCSFVEVPDSGYADLPTDEQVELGFPVASTWVEIPSMQSRELVYSYDVPGAWTSEGADQVYRLHYDHQPTIRPADLDVRIQVPDGFTVDELPEGASLSGDQVVFQRSVFADLDLAVRFIPE